MKLGVDVGNYTTLTSEGICFLSKVSKSGGFNETSDFIILDDQKYYLGDGDFDTDYRKAYKENYIQLLFGAIALSSDDVYNQVGVGLPLGQYKEDRDYLRNLILQNSSKTVNINSISKQIIIDDIEIFPEGVAAVDQNFEGIVLDIGGRTTDICLLLKEGDMRKVYNPYSLAKGTINLETDFINKINSKLGLDLTQLDVNRIMENGLFIYNKEVDIKFAIEVYRDFTESVINQIRINYPIKTHKVALIGGGAETLETSIINRLPNAFLVEDSFYANAYGYKRLMEG